MAAVVRIERRLAHQAVHADLGAQPAVGVLALDAERRALDAGDFARPMTSSSSVFQPRASPQRRYMRSSICGPVLRLGAAGAGLDVDETRCASPSCRRTCAGTRAGAPRSRACASTSSMSRARRSHRRLGARRARAARRRRRAVGRAVDAADDRCRGARARVPSSCARSGIRPDGRILELAGYFLEAFALGVVVKETP